MVSKPSYINADVLELGRAEFRKASGIENMKRDENGFLRLTPTAKRADDQLMGLNTSISSLEDKLKKYREEKSRVEKFKKTEEYKESKKSENKKKKKKQKAALIEMVFNNADAVNAEAEAEEDEDDEGYRDNKKRKAKTTTLDTTYGKRFSPLVAMLTDTVNEFDQIAKSIEEELDSPRAKGPTKYRSDTMSNLISAKGQKFNAIKELVAVAKTVSDLEYKKEKDKKAEEDSDSTKAISAIGAKFLRGGFDDPSPKKRKDKDKDKKDKKVSKKKYRDEDDDDDDEMSITSLKKRDPEYGSDEELASALADTLIKRKADFKFTPHEKAIALEGKYTLVVSVDPLSPADTWEFVAVDPSTGKEIKGFKSEHKNLFPRRKNVRLIFDIGKRKCTDRNSGRSYKLIFKN